MDFNTLEMLNKLVPKYILFIDMNQRKLQRKFRYHLDKHENILHNIAFLRSQNLKIKMSQRNMTDRKSFNMSIL